MLGHHSVDDSAGAVSQGLCAGALGMHDVQAPSHNHVPARKVIPLRKL